MDTCCFKLHWMHSETNNGMNTIENRKYCCAGSARNLCTGPWINGGIHRWMLTRFVSFGGPGLLRA